MSVIKKYTAEVLSLINHFENIYSAEFNSLSGRFRYSPGQFLHLALDEYDPSSGWPESRCFSIQTAPVDQNIKITFSIKGKFSSRMASELRKGKIVNLKLPYGELFQQEHSKENVVFIAGGTGITPFLSLFNHPDFRNYVRPKLYLGIREEGFNIYSRYLEKAMKLNSQFNVEIRYQNKEGIFMTEQIYNENGPDSTYFISGPQTMISVFKSELISLGASMLKIKSDDWV